MSALRRLSILAALAAVAVCVALPAASGAAPSASAAATCSVTKDGRRLGPTYVTLLTVSGTSCAKGKSLVRAYYRCRVANGGKKGRCTKRVLGYRCHEKRGGIPTQFSAKVTCTRGRAKVVHNYTEFT